MYNYQYVFVLAALVTRTVNSAKLPTPESSLSNVILTQSTPLQTKATPPLNVPPIIKGPPKVYQHSQTTGCPWLLPCRCFNDTIDCGSRRLSSAPSFQQHDQLPAGHLNLNNNRITAINDHDFQGLKLTEINLSFNKITNISKGAFKGLEGTIQILDLRFNHLSTLPEAIFSLKNLEELHISHNLIISADKVDIHPLSLRKFMASGNLLQKWPNWLHELSFLEELDLGYNPISAFPSDLHNLEWSLRKLVLDNCKFVKIPRELNHLSRLELVDFSFNPLSDHGIPYDSFIRQSATLKEVKMQSVNITTLPSALSSLTSLQKLDLTSNNLGTIEEDILPCGLTELILTNCGLYRIPAALSDLKNLTDLELVNNHIKAIENHDLDGFTSLSSIDLSSNALMHVSPRATGLLTSLQHLWLFDNQLTELPAVLQHLPSLLSVNIEANPLKCTCKDNWPVMWIKKQSTVRVTGYCDNLEGLEILDFIHNYTHYCHLEYLTGNS